VGELGGEVAHKEVTYAIEQWREGRTGLRPVCAPTTVRRVSVFDGRRGRSGVYIQHARGRGGRASRCMTSWARPRDRNLSIGGPSGTASMRGFTSPSCGPESVGAVGRETRAKVPRHCLVGA
jgi:hypothetical protein